MQLQSIAIRGFKSFCGPITIEFGPHITGVIGPNGSGKSNLAEAIRWVLGEQSTKQLRTQETTDVLFSGNADKKPATQASVVLTFSNESGRFPIPASEVSIGRTLQKSGESEYTVNGDIVRLLDIQHMLAQAGIGAKSYTVISQGTVDKYITSTPQARKELFNEATGVKSLQLKLHQSMLKQRRSEQHLQELQLVASELEPRLKVLEREAQKDAMRGVLTEEYTHKRKTWFHRQFIQLSKQLRNTNDAIATTAKRLIQIRKTKEEIEAAFFALPETTVSPLQDLNIKLQQAIFTFNAEQKAHNEYLAHKKYIKEQVTLTETKLTQAKSVLNAAKKASEKKSWTSEVKQVLAKAHALFEDIGLGKPIDTKALVKIQRDIKNLLQNDKTATHNQDSENLLLKIEQPLREVARLETLLSEYVKQEKELQVVSAPSKKQIELLKSAIAEHGQKTSAHQPKLALKKELSDMHEKELEAEREHSTLKANANQLTEALASLKQDILREYGTSFLHNIRTFTPSTDIPSTDEITNLQRKLAALGESDPLAMKEYEEVKNRHQALSNQISDTQKANEHIQALIKEMETHIKNRYNARFSVIQKAFSSYISLLFGGGSGELLQTEAGVEISIALPHKKTKHVQLLSGGEKALSSLALLFAILDAQKPPFLVLDEVDAALDEANAERFTVALKEKAKHTQCIVITHNRATMSHVHTLYGVTMTEPSISQVFSVKLQDLPAFT